MRRQAGLRLVARCFSRVLTRTYSASCPSRFVLKRLADNVAQRRKDPEGYFNQFLAAVERWAEQQRAAYPHAGRLGKPVGAADFEVLRPAPPKLIMSGPSMEM